jgi:hypothetical protein
MSLIDKLIENSDNFQRWGQIWDSLVESPSLNNSTEAFPSQTGPNSGALPTPLEWNAAHPPFQPPPPLAFIGPPNDENQQPSNPRTAPHQPTSYLFQAEIPSENLRSAFVPVVINGKQLFQCSWKKCKKTFIFRGAHAKSHLARHKQDFFYCDVCLTSFSRHVDMKRHKKQVHMQPASSAGS